MMGLAMLVGDREDTEGLGGSAMEIEEANCFMCKHDSDSYIRALENRRGLKNLIKCNVCGQQQHVSCYYFTGQSTTSQPNDLISTFACLPCRITQNQPELMDFEVVVGPILVDKSNSHDKITFNLSRDQANNIQRNQFYELAIYCMKIDMYTGQGKYHYYLWPSDNIVIKLNNEPQCYQVDKLCILEKRDLNVKSSNQFTYDLGDTSANDSKKLAIGLVIVRVGSSPQVLEKIIMSQTTTLEDNKAMYKEWSKGLEITIPTKDQITQTLIKWPARGKLCTHYSSIDLYTYLEFNLGNSNLQKSRWCCPMCQQRIYVKDVIFDKYLYQFMKQELPNIVEKEHLILVEELAIDTTGNLRISDDTQSRISDSILKRFLSEENKRIDSLLRKERSDLEEKFAIDSKNLLETSLSSFLPALSASDSKRVEAFRATYRTIDETIIKRIFDSEQDSQFLTSLTPLSLITHIMQHYQRLKVISIDSTLFNESVVHNNFEGFSSRMQQSVARNDVVFQVIRNYSWNRANEPLQTSSTNNVTQDQNATTNQLNTNSQATNASSNQVNLRFLATASIFLTVLLREEKFLYVKPDGGIITDFISAAFAFATFQQQQVVQTQSQPNHQLSAKGVILGGLMFFFSKAMQLNLEQIVRMIFTFLKFPTHNWNLLAMEEAASLLVEVLSSFLQLYIVDTKDTGNNNNSNSNNGASTSSFNQVEFFQKLLLGEFKAAYEANRVTLEIGILKIIVAVLVTLNPKFQQNNFKLSKEFLSHFVGRNMQIINHLKSIASQIFD